MAKRIAMAMRMVVGIITTMTIPMIILITAIPIITTITGMTIITTVKARQAPKFPACRKSA